MESTPRTTKRARSLRKTMSETERKVWQRIRGNQLPAGFARQVSIGPFYADFAARRIRLAVEIDGRFHDADADTQRDEYMCALGWKVLRIPVGEVDEDLDRVIGWIFEACVERATGKERVEVPPDVPGDCPLPAFGHPPRRDFGEGESKTLRRHRVLHSSLGLQSFAPRADS